MRVAVALALCLVLTTAFAEETIMFCRYESSIDDTGKKGPTSGEVLLRYTFVLPIGKPNNVQMRTNKPPCSEFTGSGSVKVIKGTCTATVENSSGATIKMTRTFSLDRASAVFQERVQYNGKGTIVHSGR